MSRLACSQDQSERPWVREHGGGGRKGYAPDKILSRGGEGAIAATAFSLPRSLASCKKSKVGIAECRKVGLQEWEDENGSLIRCCVVVLLEKERR